MRELVKVGNLDMRYGHNSDRTLVFRFGCFVGQDGVEPMFPRRKKHSGELSAGVYWVIRLQADCFTTSPALSAFKTSLNHDNLWSMCPVLGDTVS